MCFPTSVGPNRSINSGKVVPAFEEIINSPINSRIVEVYKRGGDSVDVGTPILKLDLQSAETEYRKQLDEEQMKTLQLEQQRVTNHNKLSEMEMNLKVSRMELDRKAVELRNERYLDSLGAGTTDKVRQDMEQLSAPDALADIFRIIQRANKYIDETEPWVLNKQGEKAKLATVMHTLCECIKFAATLLKPFIPDTADRIFQKLGLPSAENFDGLTFGGIGEGVRVNKGENLFNRIDVEKELKELEKYAEENTARPQEEQIDVSDFAKVKLCTAEVTECRRVDNSDKLLLLTVKIGEETRKVVSGIAHCYTPDQLVGKTVILVKNLKPAKIRGIESNGMILCVSDGKKVVFVTPEQPTGSGKEVR